MRRVETRCCASSQSRTTGSIPTSIRWFSCATRRSARSASSSWRGLQLHGSNACPPSGKNFRRLNTKLDQIQDLGGCRVVLRSIADAKKLFEFYQTSSKHQLHKPTDYIAQPKVGYRSY